MINSMLITLVITVLFLCSISRLQILLWDLIAIVCLSIWQKFLYFICSLTLDRIEANRVSLDNKITPR